MATSVLIPFMVVNLTRVDIFLEFLNRLLLKVDNIFDKGLHIHLFTSVSKLSN